MPPDLCSALSWVSMDAFQEGDRSLIGSLKSDIVQARDRLETLFQEARASASLGATSSQLGLSGGGIATIPCVEALLAGGAMVLTGAFGAINCLTEARQKTLQHRETVQRLECLERELRQVLGNAMAGDLRLRAHLEEEAGILYADLD